MVISTSQPQAYRTAISNGEACIIADTTADKGGSGQHFRPHDLLEAAYAACLNMTTRMVLESMQLPYQEVCVRVELDRSAEASTTFRFHIEIVGDLDEASKQLVLKKVRACPVKKTLSKQLLFEEV
uniref:Uncharacterized protein n=1 Tax=Thermosporothrix sp. COM3 TaxID=2490863 RepID=A0A455SGL7_9CHLR|nr:hypothetical protein KTC_23440 [Thermosporothrix sp. COM3]